MLCSVHISIERCLVRPPPSERLKFAVFSRSLKQICFGNFHQDDADVTFLFYPDENEKDKGGTEFKDVTKVDYKTNRLIIFDARIWHKANTNLSNEMRHSIAWKTLI